MYSILRKKVVRASQRMRVPYKLPVKPVRLHFHAESLGPGHHRMCKALRTVGNKNGYRIVNVAQLSAHMTTITRHVALCPSAKTVSEAGALLLG
jgi:hypothetical protein